MRECIVNILENIIVFLQSVIPFAVYYRMQNKEIIIYGVLDCRRDPAWIRKRL